MDEASVHAETIRKLERLNQLESVTAEQRIRIEKYRTMYETLKTESEQLEESKHRQSNELKHLKDELNEIQRRAQEAIAEARADRDLKTSECEQLRVQILTPQKLEIMKVKITEEIEMPFKAKIEALESEIEKYRADFNRIRYDYSFLKSEYEHETTQNKTIFEEIEAKHIIEVETLQKKLDTLQNQALGNDITEVHKMHKLQKENAALTAKNNNLLQEVSELRAEKENLFSQSESNSRMQSRQLSDVTNQLHAVEMERDTHVSQIEKLLKEATISSKELDSRASDQQRLERENNTFRNQLEDLIHSHKMEINQMKIDVSKEKAVIEKERDSLLADVSLLKNKLCIAEKSISDLKENLSLKEQEVAQRVQALHEVEKDKMVALEKTKSDLESQVSNLEKKNYEILTDTRLKIEEIEDKARFDRDVKLRLEKELAALKFSLAQANEKCSDFARESVVNGETKHKYLKLVTATEALEAANQELKNNFESSTQENNILKKEIEMLQKNILQQQETYRINDLEKKEKHEVKIKELLSSVEELKKEKKEMKSKYEKLHHKAKKMSKKNKLESEVLTDQLNLLKSKAEQTELEKENMLRNVQLEKERTRKRFDKLRQRQNHFNQVLHQSSSAVSFPEISPIREKTSPIYGDTQRDFDLGDI